MPLWKADPMPTPTPGMPSAQVAFDGFCGHEVVGEIMESKSEQFSVGSTWHPPTLTSTGSLFRKSYPSLRCDAHGVPPAGH